MSLKPTESPVREASPGCSSSLAPAAPKPTAQRHRKAASTGGGRAWSKEEVRSQIPAQWSQFDEGRRRHTSSRPACIRCLISILLSSSGRPNSLAACTITNFPLAANVADGVLPSRQPRLWIVVPPYPLSNQPEIQHLSGNYPPIRLHVAQRIPPGTMKAPLARPITTYPSFPSPSQPRNAQRIRQSRFVWSPQILTALASTGTSIWSVLKRFMMPTASISGR